ncbi:MAG: response regulator [Bacteroidota bacterium]|jgi:DNA-binding response OmpR family regulator
MEKNCILIIDDDVWIQKMLSKILESFGFTVLPASNGYEGISLAVEHQPLCVILDILMPELNGHQTLKILKIIKSTQQIPVLMLSAMSDSENLGLAVKSGIAGFISKPFNRNSVFDKLMNLFGKEALEAIGKQNSEC